jgi:hypothetical protein
MTYETIETEQGRIDRLYNDFGACLVFGFIISGVGIVLFLDWLMRACFINGFNWRVIHLQTWQIHSGLFIALLITVNYAAVILTGRIYGKMAKT